LVQEWELVPVGIDCFGLKKLSLRALLAYHGVPMFRFYSGLVCALVTIGFQRLQVSVLTWSSRSNQQTFQSVVS